MFGACDVSPPLLSSRHRIFSTASSHQSRSRGVRLVVYIYFLCRDILMCMSRMAEMDTLAIIFVYL